jgi:menaquinol-cytochrome c reductase iron-sulfur subunit
MPLPPSFRVAFCAVAFIFPRTTNVMPEPLHPCAGPDRRGFLKKFCATVLGAVLGLAPVAAGLRVMLDPLRRRGVAGSLVRVTSLDALPADGVPRKFPVLADRTDAWNKFQNVPVGAVYLRRTTAGKLEALNVVCPHAGCFVDFSADRGKFLCPCHNSLFAVDGKLADASSPAARGLDSLEVELRHEREVWVKFQNFEAGKVEKVPV